MKEIFIKKPKEIEVVNEFEKFNYRCAQVKVVVDLQDKGHVFEGTVLYGIICVSKDIADVIFRKLGVNGDATGSG